MSRLWRWSPNWNASVGERIEWLTAINRARDLSEQAIRLRTHPRRVYTFDLLATQAEQRRLESALFADQSGEWLLPIYPDVQRLAADLAASATSVPCATATRDFADGGQALLTWPGGESVLDIDTVESGSLELATPTAADVPAGARLYPLRAATLTASQPLQRATGSTLTGSVEFRLAEGSSRALDTPTLYRSLPLLETRPNWAEPPAPGYERAVAEIDFEIGQPYRIDTGGRAEILQQQRYTIHTREAIAEFLGQQYRMAGRFGVGWLPSWAGDAVCAAAFAAVDTTLDIESIGYVADLDQAINRRDLRIQFADGDVIRRRITGAATVGDTVERLTLDSAIGKTGAASAIRKISFLQLARRESDALEIEWVTPALIQATLNYRAVNHDL